MAESTRIGMLTPSSNTILEPVTAAILHGTDSSMYASRVPVTRIDFSGFGESTFSDWRNPAGVPPTISKTIFHVMVGRTALEVVQAFSIKYPYAVRVVRTITIERTNAGCRLRLVESSRAGARAVAGAVA